jgi:hypothetical protein
MIVLITVETDVVPADFQQTRAMSEWLADVLSDMGLETDYDVLESTTGEQRGNKRVLVFAVLLRPRKLGLTREQWLKSANGKLHTLNENQLIHLTQLFDIVIDDGEESEVSVEFIASFNEDEEEADDHWEDVEFSNDASRSTIGLNRSNASSRRVSPTRRPRARRTSMVADDDDEDAMADDLMDDMSAEGDPAAPKSVSSSSKQPLNATSSSSSSFDEKRGGVEATPPTAPTNVSATVTAPVVQSLPSPAQQAPTTSSSVSTSSVPPTSSSADSAPAVDSNPQNLLCTYRFLGRSMILVPVLTWLFYLQHF